MAPIVLFGAVLGIVLPPAAGVLASPDGAEWTTSVDPEGCRSCHLGAPDAVDTASVSIEGLPEQPVAGRRYELEIVVEDPALRNAGFLLSVAAGRRPAGSLAAVDERTETSGASARSTWEGSFTDQPGMARWRLDWTAPAQLDGPLLFDLWANAGNDDLSPLGDRPQHRSWLVPAAR
jgi:hypothetical protein